MPSGLARKTAYIFGSSLAPTGNIETFGSAAGGSPSWSGDPQAIQTPQWLLGILGSLVNGQSPFWQDENGFRLTVTWLVSYLSARGIPEWDSNVSAPGVSLTTYNFGDVCRRGPNPSVANATIYVCIGNGINSDPLVDTNNWITLAASLQGPNLIKASVVFDGTTGPTCNVFQSFNVSSVTKTGTGSYLVNFQNPLPTDGSGNGIYGLAGASGTPNGAIPGNGDNCTICAGVGTSAIIKTGAQASVYAWYAGPVSAGGASEGLVNPQMLSVMFF